MYMVPYFLKNVAKNLLKSKLSKIIEDISDDIIDNIFNHNPDEKYQNLVLGLEEKVKNSILDILKETFSIFDELYANSEERKKIFNISDRKCHRSIVTIFGILEFYRIYYYEKNDKSKHFFLIDTLFDLPAYDRYDKIVKGIAIDNAINTNQNKGSELTNKQINPIISYLKETEKCKISRQSIYLWIDKWEVPEVEYDPIETDSDTLYIMIDEKYIHEQLKEVVDKENIKINDSTVDSKNIEDIKLEAINLLNVLKNKPLLLPAPKKKTKHFIMSKAFIAFTDIETKAHRRILKNKVTFLTTSRSPWDEYMEFISKICDFKQFKNIKVLSDAGSWITAGISNLKLFVENVVIPCLCEFHAKQKINRSTKDESIRKQLYKAIDDNDKQTFIEIFNNIIKDKAEKRQKTLKSYKHYIVGHWTAIQNMEKSKYKSSMESHISHNIAKYFSYEPKAYSRRHIQKLIKLRQHKENGINILALYIKTANSKEKVTLKKEELSFSMFERNSSNIPIIYNSNSYTSMAIRALVQ